MVHLTQDNLKQEVNKLLNDAYHRSIKTITGVVTAKVQVPKIV